nr:hypothetical protein [Tanacetum cinerariifolium]
MWIHSFKWNNSHYGYDCQPQFSFVYEQEPSYNQNCNEHSVQYKEYLENSSNEIAALNSNQEKEKPPQDSNIRQLIKEDCCIEACRKQKQNMEDTMLELIEVFVKKSFIVCILIISTSHKKKQEVKNIVEKATKRGTLQNFRVNKSSISLNNTSQISPVHAITPVLPTEEPEYSLSMGYEHLSTISETEFDEVIESSTKNLLPIPSEYEVTSDDENECDVPVKDESFPVFTTFSNPIFDCNDDFTSSDDESISDEDVPIEDFKVYSNPLFDDEIDPHCFNVESNFVESLSNRNTLIDSSSKFDFLEKFSGALLPTSIADEESIRREHEEYISLIKKLFSINPFPRLLENFQANTIIETLPISTIPVEDSDSQREEIDIFTGTDELLPPDIESDNYDSEGDINFLEELLVNDSISHPENELFYFDNHDDPSFPHPPPEPSDIKIFFKSDSGVLTTNVVKGNSEYYVHMPNILSTLPTFNPLYPMYDTLLPFLSLNEDKVFKPDILSYLLVSHQDKTNSDFSKNPMMLYGGDIPLLDVQYLHFYPP